MAEKTPAVYDAADVGAPDGSEVVSDRMDFCKVAQSKQKFKQTEVGLIPEDWGVEVVGDHFDLQLGKMLDSERNQGVLRPYLGNKHVQWFRVITEDLPTVPLTPTDLCRFRLMNGDLLVCEGGEVGRAAIWTSDIECYYQKALHRLRQKGEATPVFFLYLLRHLVARGHLVNYVTQTSIAHLPREKLALVPFQLPDPNEQEAITNALSDVDKLLGALDRLIAKKRDLKQAAMQELLSGKRRLPGFTKPWETKTLGEMGLISGAGVDKKIRPNEVPVRLVNYMDVYLRDLIYSSDLDHHVTARVDQAQRCAVQAGDVFFTPTSEVRNDIGHSAVAMEDIPDAAYSYHVVRLRIKDDWDLQFRAYAFKTKAFMDQATILCEGSGTRYVITLPKFRSMAVQVPSDKDEQTAIATILSDIDAEIAALESRREKTRLLKQGMMQELLTGRIRLVESKKVTHR